MSRAPINPIVQAADPNSMSQITAQQGQRGRDLMAGRQSFMDAQQEGNRVMGQAYGQAQDTASKMASLKTSERMQQSQQGATSVENMLDRASAERIKKIEMDRQESLRREMQLDQQKWADLRQDKLTLQAEWESSNREEIALLRNAESDKERENIKASLSKRRDDMTQRASALGVRMTQYDTIALARAADQAERRARKAKLGDEASISKEFRRVESVRKGTNDLLRGIATAKSAGAETYGKPLLRILDKEAEGSLKQFSVNTRNQKNLSEEELASTAKAFYGPLLKGFRVPDEVAEALSDALAHPGEMSAILGGIEDISPGTWWAIDEALDKIVKGLPDSYKVGSGSVTNDAKLRFRMLADALTIGDYKRRLNVSSLIDATRERIGEEEYIRLTGDEFRDEIDKTMRSLMGFGLDQELPSPSGGPTSPISQATETNGVTSRGGYNYPQELIGQGDLQEKPSVPRLTPFSNLEGGSRVGLPGGPSGPVFSPLSPEDERTGRQKLQDYNSLERRKTSLRGRLKKLTDSKAITPYMNKALRERIKDSKTDEELQRALKQVEVWETQVRRERLGSDRPPIGIGDVFRMWPFDTFEGKDVRGYRTGREKDRNLEDQRAKEAASRVRKDSLKKFLREEGIGKINPSLERKFLKRIQEAKTPRDLLLIREEIENLSLEKARERGKKSLMRKGGKRNSKISSKSNRKSYSSQTAEALRVGF